MHLIKLSVRGIVEFILRSGDIDASFLSSKRNDEGTRIHKLVQNRRKQAAKLKNTIYDSEVSFKTVYDYEDFQFSLEGRADGVAMEDERVIIEEIKSTTKPLNLITPTQLHLAQAKCYGFMFLLQTLFTEITLRITYCNIETEEESSYDFVFDFEELMSFVEDLIAQYYLFAKMDFERVQRRNETGQALKFPFGSYRSGQREMAVSVFAAIKQSKKIFIQAPTGTGKTISALFPAVKYAAENSIDKIFYLTAKAITRQVAEDALSLMHKGGLRLCAITLTAKDRICFMEETHCTPTYCPYAKGHFDRINSAILDLISNETHLTRKTVTDYANKHMVCPFEYALDLSLFCDVIICDYNHVYDPKAQLKRYFSDEEKNYVLLHDESHNLVDRAREMFSASIGRGDFAEVKKLVKGQYRKAINAVIKYFTETKDAPAADKELPLPLVEALYGFIEKAEIFLVQADPSDEAYEPMLELFFKALDFIRVAELFDHRFIVMREKDIRLFCLDPSHLLAEVQKLVRSSVFFSATLTPMDYFRNVLGGNDDDYLLKLRSPFPRENFCLLIDDMISTMYKHRELSYERIADDIAGLVAGKMGNYMAFFPSYDYMTRVHGIFSEKYPNNTCIIQSQYMDDNQREAFLSEFSEDSAVLGFVVLGGLFSEGIDLTGDKLIGAAVVSVGLPLITAERDHIRDYYSGQNNQGFEYAYMYPGMNKVLQAAGRVIRTMTDRGVVLLIDSRFTHSRYVDLFPDEWLGFWRVDSRHQAKGIKAALEQFWR